MAQTLKHKRSSVVSNGSPKLPTTDQIAVGEIAINFAEGYETLSTRNNNNGIATFSSDSVLDKKYISSGAVMSAISAVTVTLENDEYTIAQAFNEQNDRITSLEDAGFLTDFTETDPTVPAWAKASSKPTYTAAEVGAMATSERSNYLGTGTTYFDDAEYDSNTKRINFKKNNTVVDYIDATDFIKDGMVSSVTVSNGNLVISFNTEAGREDIELALTQIFNPNNYYDKTAADAKFLSAYTETDPTVPSWAKQANKPTYTASEVGALPSTTDVPTQASIAGSGFTKNGNVQSDWLELDQTADSYILNSPVFSATGALDKVYGIRTSIIECGDGYKYFFPDGDGLWMAGYNENSSSHKILITDDVIKSAGIPGGDSGKYSASTTQYGLVKIGNFLSGHNGFVSVATGTNSTTVARGDHSHTGMLTGVTINGAAASVSNGVASANLPVLPTVTSSDNGKVLTVVNGQWSAATPLTVYTGNNAPDNSMGNNGDIYLQTS